MERIMPKNRTGVWRPFERQRYPGFIPRDRMELSRPARPTRFSGRVNRSGGIVDEVGAPRTQRAAVEPRRVRGHPSSRTMRPSRTCAINRHRPPQLWAGQPTRIRFSEVGVIEDFMDCMTPVYEVHSERGSDGGHLFAASTLQSNFPKWVA
jgi:hypothetical protein